MPILFQYRNIRHLLGMYITKQAEQEIYLIVQKKLRWCPPKKKTQLPKLAEGALSYLSGLTNFDSRLGLIENGLKKTTGVKGRTKKRKKLRDDARASLPG